MIDEYDLLGDLPPPSAGGGFAAVVVIVALVLLFSGPCGLWVQ